MEEELLKITQHIVACGAVMLFILGGSSALSYLTETTENKWLVLAAAVGGAFAAGGGLILWALPNRKNASDRNRELAELAAFDAACNRFDDAISDFKNSPTGEKALVAIHHGDDLYNLTKAHNGGMTDLQPGYDMLLEAVRNQAKVATAIAPPLLAASLVAVAFFVFPTTTSVGAFWTAWLSVVTPSLLFFTGWYGWQQRRKGKDMMIAVINIQRA